MALAPRRRTISMGSATTHRDGIDEGLRAYMLRVYNYMSLGLGLTGVIAFAVANTPAVLQLFFSQTGPTGLGYLAIFSPLAFVLVLSFGMHKLSTPTVQLLFWAFAAAMGLSLTSIFIVYTGTSIARVFFITASLFAAMSLYGYTTKRDLTSIGSFLFMGLIGIIIASVVNMFLQSTIMEFVISVIGVLVFVGLTAYDTQNIKSEYSAGDSTAASEKKAIFGALRLYLDFINLFIMLLRLFGNRN